MNLASLPFDGVAGLLRDVLDRFVPDPAQKLAAIEAAQSRAFELAQQGTFAERADAQAATAQAAVDQAEASSSDPLQHWRGGLGWVCTFAYGWNFVAQPLCLAAAALAGRTVQLPALELAPLATLTLGMLGLGGLHVAERIKGAA